MTKQGIDFDGIFVSEEALARTEATLNKPDIHKPWGELKEQEDLAGVKYSELLREYKGNHALAALEFGRRWHLANYQDYLSGATLAQQRRKDARQWHGREHIIKTYQRLIDRSKNPAAIDLNFNIDRFTEGQAENNIRTRRWPLWYAQKHWPETLKRILQDGQSAGEAK